MLPDGSICQFPCAIDLWYFAQWLSGRKPQELPADQSGEQAHHQFETQQMDIPGPHKVSTTVSFLEPVVR